MDDRDDIDDEHSSQAKIVDFSPRGGEESLVEALSCLPNPDDPDVARHNTSHIGFPGPGRSSGKALQHKDVPKRGELK